MASEYNMVTLTTPFGSDALYFESMTGTEGVSEPFAYTIIANGKQNSLSADTIIGKSVTVAFPLPSCQSGSRYINGICTRFTVNPTMELTTRYIIEIRPWLWMMSMQSDCVTYQNMSVADIVQKVCTNAGYNFVSNKLSSSASPLPYVIQYNETAFHFVSRLMEEAGIFYYFTHTSSSHTLVMADSPDAFQTCTGSDSLKYQAANMGGTPAAQIGDVTLTQHAVPAQFDVSDYYYQTPDTDLSASASGDGTGKLFEYPGNYQQKSDGSTIASQRLDAREADKVAITAVSPASGLFSGGTFSVTEHDISSINTKWAVTHMHITASLAHFTAQVTAVLATASYRPLRVTPKPVIPGLLPAIVTGPQGEEISVDNYGCITVQFYWDRVGKKNETSSCPIRVSQPWAGKSIGTMFTPRVGTEVLVGFENGDPNRPIVIGQMYNANMTYPYPLPDAGTKTAMCTMSSKGGSEGHQMYFEDKAGSEEAFFSATKDVTVAIKNSRTTTISDADDTLTLESGNRSVEIKTGTDTLKCKGKRSVTVEADEEHSTTGKYGLTSTGDLSLETKANHSCTVGGNSDEKVTGNVSQTVTGDYNLTVSGNMTINVTGQLTLNSTGNMTIASSQSLTTSASMSATHSGTSSITLDGMQFTLNGNTGGTIVAGPNLNVTGALVNIA